MVLGLLLTLDQTIQLQIIGLLVLLKMETRWVPVVLAVALIEPYMLVTILPRQQLGLFAQLVIVAPLTMQVLELMMLPLIKELNLLLLIVLGKRVFL